MATPAANTETTPVLIVGAGPTGLTTAILLAKYGIQSTVIDRYETYLTQPKAHAINPRSLEILRQTGLDTEKLRAAGSTPGDAADVRFALSMAGLQLGSLPYERQGEDTKALTPEPLFNIPQYHLQQFLLDAAAALPEITMRKPFEWQSIRKADDNTLRSRVINRTTKAEIAISSDYVLFCDGANSQSRESIGIPFSPLPGQAQTPIHHISVHFDADLSSFDPGVLWFIVSPASTGAFISYERRSSWVFVFNYNPEETSADRFDEHYCRNLVDQAIGKVVPYNVLSITLWSTFPRIAEFYQSPLYSNAFILGDAAHAFPPTGGLGVNTGIADAHNLTWKLHAVRSGQAGESLLKTYGSERRPVAVANAMQSTRNQQALMQLFGASRHLDPARPQQLQGDRELQDLIQRAIEANIEHFDSIQLQIGYVYGQPVQGPCNVYTPSLAPGARVPHGWVRAVRHASPNSGIGRTTSTLDLIDSDLFSLIVGPKFLPEVGDTISVPLGQLSVRVLRHGTDFILDEEASAEVLGLRSEEAGVLVRPDQHVLAHVTSVEEIRDALAKYLLLLPV